MSMSMKSSLVPCKLLPSRSAKKQQVISRRSLKVKAMGIDPVHTIGEFSAGVGSMYFMMSYNEYIAHRYYQHNEVQKLDQFKSLKAKYPEVVPKLDGGGHVEHHAETLDDMMLRTDARWKASTPCRKLDESGDPWRGTAFSWPVTGLMTVQMLPSVYPWFMGALHWSFTDTTLFFLPSMVLHALVWNALHPQMHGLPDVPASVGAPSSVLAPYLDTPYFRWLYDNHAGHHVSGGTTNYNVACPLFDHIIGTYEDKEVWEANLAAKEANKAKALVLENV